MAYDRKTVLEEKRSKRDHFILLAVSVALFGVLAVAQVAHSARIKDIANIEGFRANQLVGYGR